MRQQTVVWVRIATDGLSHTRDTKRNYDRPDRLDRLDRPDTVESSLFNFLSFFSLYSVLSSLGFLVFWFFWFFLFVSIFVCVWLLIFFFFFFSRLQPPRSTLRVHSIWTLFLVSFLLVALAPASLIFSLVSLFSLSPSLLSLYSLSLSALSLSLLSLLLKTLLATHIGTYCKAHRHRQTDTVRFSA